MKKKNISALAMLKKFVKQAIKHTKKLTPYERSGIRKGLDIGKDR